MDVKDSLAGEIVRTIGGYQAFLPHPLPTKIEWNNF